MGVGEVGKSLANSLKEDYLKDADSSSAYKLIQGMLADLLKNKYPILHEKFSFQPEKCLQRYSDYSKFLSELLEVDSIIAAYQLSSLYSLLICQKDRYRNGVYFTPPEISKIVLKEIKSQHGGDIWKSSFIDPCSGGGAFIAPLISILRKGMIKRGVGTKERISHIQNNISGIDVNGSLNDLSMLFCLMEMYPDILNTGDIPNFNIKTGNFLTNDLNEESFDVVIGNPPFRRLTVNEQSVYKVKYSDSNNGGSNLYGLFVHKSIELVKPGGLVSLILPASLLAGARYAKLRGILGEKADVCSIHTMQERTGVFMDVQQETVILTLKKIREGTRRRKVTKVSTICNDVKTEVIGKTLLQKNNSPWIVPRRKEQLKASVLFSKNLPTLESYGISIRTGSVVWNRDKRPRYSNGGKENNRRKRYPLIWSDCIGIDGTFQFERAKKRAPEEVFVETDANDPEVLRSSSIAVKRTTNSKQFRRIISSYINTSFVKEYGGYLGENHINLLLPNSKGDVSDLELLSNILNSEPVDELFRCISGSSAVSKYELSRLPLPDLEVVQKRIDTGEKLDDAVRLSLYDV